MSEPQITVRKIAARLTASSEEALRYGFITEEQARANGWTPSPPMPWRRRVRSEVGWWWHGHRPRVHFGPCEMGDE